MNFDELEFSKRFNNLIHDQNTRRKNEETLLKLAENLIKEIEVSQENQRHLQDNLKQMTDHKLRLEEGRALLDYTEYEEKFNLLDIQIEEHKRTTSEVTEKLEQEIANLKIKIDSDRLCFEVREKELLDEMEVIKAQKTLECDELESRLKRQLVDRTSKLRQAQSEVKMLNLEISNLRDQISIQQNLNIMPRNKTLAFESSVKSNKNMGRMNRSNISSDRYSNDELDYAQCHWQVPYVVRLSEPSSVVARNPAFIAVNLLSRPEMMDNNMSHSNPLPSMQGNKDLEKFTTFSISSSSCGVNPNYVPTRRGNDNPPSAQACIGSAKNSSKTVRKRRLCNPDADEDDDFFD